MADIKRDRTYVFGNIAFDLYDLIYVFSLSGIIGTVYETILIFILHGVIENRSGSMFTPVNYVYGIGAVILFLALKNIKDPVHIFICGAVIGGVTEYSLSIGQELLFGSVSWDYSKLPLNINGRTTLPYMVVWGLMCLLAVKVLFPKLLAVVHKIPEDIRKRTAIIVLIILAVDALVSSAAVIRYSERSRGLEVSNTLESVLDSRFDDVRMKRRFPNMRIR